MSTEIMDFMTCSKLIFELSVRDFVDLSLTT